MKHFPVFLGTVGTRIAVIGGGEAATQKVRLLSRTEARVEVYAADLTDELAQMVGAGKVHHVATVPDAATLAGVRMAIIATGAEQEDTALANLARGAGALVNVVDRPALSDFVMPAIVDRDPVVVAIGTEGTAPVLARQIKTRIERMLEPNLGRFAALLGSLRDRVARRIPPHARRRFWEWAVNAQRPVAARDGVAASRRGIEAALQSGGAPKGTRGRVNVIDPGTGEPDLMTLRAVEHMQTADLIVHDRDCPVAVLDLARRDARRMILDRSRGPEDRRHQQAALHARAEARAGHDVVWLSKAAMSVQMPTHELVRTNDLEGSQSASESDAERRPASRQRHCLCWN